MGIESILQKLRSSRVDDTSCATTTTGVAEANTMVANGRYGGDPPPYAQRGGRKRPGDDSGHTGDRKRVNYNNYKQERPFRLQAPTLQLATSPKGRPEYPVHQSPSSASPRSNTSTRNNVLAGEFRSTYHLSIHVHGLTALFRTLP